VRIALLGPLEVWADSDSAPVAVEVSGARLRALLTVLALSAPRPVSARALVDALWGDEPPADETNALQSLVSRLRRALGDPELVRQSAAGYQLTLPADSIDVRRFEALAHDGREALRAGDAASAATVLAEALGLWRGEPAELAATGYDDALLTRLHEQAIDARGDLIDARLSLGRADEVIAELGGLVATHPLRERFAVLLVRALHAAGRTSEALASYERARSILADQLGADPSPELQAAHLAALRDEPAPTQPVRHSNLRATLTSFVGRDEQLAQIGHLLSSGRLVTLVGPGGAGKTRLATAAASAVADTHAREGVWLAELAPVTDPADVPQTVLGSLGLRDHILLERTSALTPRDAMSRLVDALVGRDALLVLDNCEHLVEAAAQLAEQLLTLCPGLRVLATSREPLAIFGEALVVVPPLGQPAADADAKTARTYPAVQLFADRALDVQPGFEIDDTNVRSVIEIVRRLDGLPLAIELAAARLRSLPAAEIERRLSDRFRLLTGGSRTAMPRHRTLWAVVEWSWELLAPDERELAERLAVFVGGVTPSAAAAVCRPDLDLTAVEDLLTSLVDKSLLQVVASTDLAPRYRMLETIREFGTEKLAERGEIGALRLAHADYYAALVAEADPHLRSAEQLEWMALMDTERDNILAAVKFYGDDGRAADAIALVNLLGWYWMTVSNHGDIVTWVSFALDAEGEVDPVDRLMSEAFLAINALAWNAVGSHDEVEATLNSLAAVSRRMAQAPPGRSKMMTLLAPVIAMFVGDTELVGPLTDRALADDDPWIAASMRTFRASMAENAGDLESMRADVELALKAFRGLGERWGIANTLQVLGQLELMEGNLSAAADAYREALELATAVGSREDLAAMRLRLADILIRLGQPDAALEQGRLARETTYEPGSALEVLFTSAVEVEIARNIGDIATAKARSAEAIEGLRKLPSVHPVHSHGMAIVLATAVKLDLVDGATDSDVLSKLREAHQLAIETKDMPIVATVGLSSALYAEHLGDLGAAAEILGAAAQIRGADDVTHPDIVGLDERLGGLRTGPYADAYTRGREMTREAALSRVDPATFG